MLTSPIQSGGYGKKHEIPKNNVCVQIEGSFSLDMSHETGGKPYIGTDNSKIAWSEEEMVTNRPFTQPVHPPEHAAQSSHAACDIILCDGSVVIAAITSCTNTSNPGVMLAAGLLAKKAVLKGLKVNSKIKNKASSRLSRCDRLST